MRMIWVGDHLATLAELKARGLIYICLNYACLGFTIFVLGLTLCNFEVD